MSFRIRNIKIRPLIDYKHAIERNKKGECAGCTIILDKDDPLCTPREYLSYTWCPDCLERRKMGIAMIIEGGRK